MSAPNVAVVGATGAVGGVLLGILAERRFPIADLKLLASKRSAGRKISFAGRDHLVEELREDSFGSIDLVFSAAGGSIARWFAPHAVAAGAVVIDKSSAWRYEAEVPLVVPEVNGDELSRHRGIIACPNCSTIQMVMALAPIDRAFPISRVVASTYQAVSGAGAAAVAELDRQISDISGGRAPQASVLPRQIAQNVVPEVETFRPEDGYTSEEWKMAAETRKIMARPQLRISATCVRVPVARGHSESINLEFDQPVDVDEVRELLANTAGIQVVDAPLDQPPRYPTALDADGNDSVWVGRIRRDVSTENGLCLWVVSDNLRKGAATNSVQIAEQLLERGLLAPAAPDAALART